MNASDLRQRSFGSVDRVDGDTILTAIRCIQKLAGGMDLDFCVVVAAFEILGQGDDRLQDLQSAVCRVVRKYGDSVTHFTDHIGKLAVRAKGKVPRARARIEPGERRIVGYERAFAAVELVDEQLVEA